MLRSCKSEQACEYGLCRESWLKIEAGQATSVANKNAAPDKPVCLALERRSAPGKYEEGSMPEDLNELMKRHSAGATVVPKTPFSDIPTYRNSSPLDPDFLKKWVIPFYMKILNSVEDVKFELKAIKPHVTDSVVTKLLGDFNWRTRSTGAYFSGILNLQDKIELIGNLFLKSEVCYAGETYAIVLATLNRDAAVEYFEKYLDYYLTCPQYYFEQDIVLAGLKTLTATDISYNFHRFQEMHLEYKKSQGLVPDLDRYVERFNRMRKEIEEIRSF